MSVAISPLLAEAPSSDEVQQIRTIAHELAALKPWETLQITPSGKYLERRFKIPFDEAAIARTLAPYNPATHRITGARFASHEEHILLHVIETAAPDSLIDESPTNNAIGR